MSDQSATPEVSEKTGNPRRTWGPGLLVTAAFIGPGTVLSASKAGAAEGNGLLWVVVLSVIAAVVFQEMAARLGIVTGRDLATTLRERPWNPLIRLATLILMVVAILVGNAAYQAGNLSGAATGLADLAGAGHSLRVALAWTVALVAGALLLSGHVALIQNVLIALVAVMSVLFLVCAVIVRPDVAGILQGMVIPRFTADSLFLVLSLLGTTVVPYNLFLHSRTAMIHWHRDGQSDEDCRQALRESRTDTIAAVSLGGLITIAIVVTSASAFFQTGVQLDSVSSIAGQLRPLLGPASPAVFSAGLAAAGLTSAITAPLAAGFVAAGCFGWSRGLADWRTQLVMQLIVAAGLIVNLTLEASPAQIIIVAQIANGLILPLVALFLLVAMNGQSFPRRFRNGWRGNTLGVFLILVVSLLAFRQLQSTIPKVHQWLFPAETAAAVTEFPAAEDTGVEPATGCPATDFESAC